MGGVPVHPDVLVFGDAILAAQMLELPFVCLGSLITAALKHLFGLGRSAAAKLVLVYWYFATVNLVQEGGEDIPGGPQLVPSQKVLLVTAHGLEDEAAVGVRNDRAWVPAAVVWRVSANAERERTSQ